MVTAFKVAPCKYCGEPTVQMRVSRPPCCSDCYRKHRDDRGAAKPRGRKRGEVDWAPEYAAILAMVAAEPGVPLKRVASVLGKSRAIANVNRLVEQKRLVRVVGANQRVGVRLWPVGWPCKFQREAFSNASGAALAALAVLRDGMTVREWKKEAGVGGVPTMQVRANALVSVGLVVRVGEGFNVQPARRECVAACAAGVGCAKWGACGPSRGARPEGGVVIVDSEDEES